MKFDDLPYRCQFCNHLRAVSLMMDGNHEYGCGKYPITNEKREGNCSKFDGDLPNEENEPKFTHYAVGGVINGSSATNN